MRLHALQYLRAVAALAVVYSHAAFQVDSYEKLLLEAGSFGVDIFFVISGFIMIYIAKPENTFGQFMINRIRRVVPLYWFFTLLMGVILLVLPDVFKATSFSIKSLIYSLGFVPHWSIATPTAIWPIVAPGWSLVYEMYFYFVFALSLFLPFKYRIACISLIITAVFIAARSVSMESSAIVKFFSHTIVFEFIFGMLLAYAWQRGLRIKSSVAWLILIAASVALFLPIPGPRVIGYGLPSLLIVGACLYINIGENKLGVLLGDASYALYLSHIFTLGVLRKVLPPFLGEGLTAALLFVAISIVVCTIASLFVHQFIDNWLLRHERLARFRK